MMGGDMLRLSNKAIILIGACALTIKHSVFSFMTGLIVEILFVLSFVYNAV